MYDYLNGDCGVRVALDYYNHEFGCDIDNLGTGKGISSSFTLDPNVIQTTIRFNKELILAKSVMDREMSVQDNADTHLGVVKQLIELKLQINS